MYGRKSANSTEKPLRGDRCRPARNPSTIHRATISMRPRAARLAGSKRSARAAWDVSMRARKLGKVDGSAAEGQIPPHRCEALAGADSCILLCIQTSSGRRSIMGTRPSYLAARTAVLLPLVAALSACATIQSASTPPSTGGPEAVAERGPRVRIWTTDEFGTGSRVRASFRLDDDAYV